MPRSAMRLLHTRDDDDRTGLTRPKPHPSEHEIREAISGQICRCTGYTTIVRSIRWAATHPAGMSTAESVPGADEGVPDEAAELDADEKTPAAAGSAS